MLCRPPMHSLGERQSDQNPALKVGSYDPGTVSEDVF